MGAADWADYLAGFHTDRPGITERVLSRAGGGDEGDPYDWLAAAVPGGGRVLDLACGSAPVQPRLPGRAYVGIDLSAAELSLARHRAAGRLVRGSASTLPTADGSIDVVVCAMALQVLTPLPSTLAEIARVLAPGGRLVATMPDRGPLRVADLPTITGLLGVLGRGLGYPNDRLLPHLPALLARAGLRLLGDERRRYNYRLTDTADAETFLASLYLPGLPARRYRAALALLRTMARARVTLPVPVRRIVALRH
jgi:SAM-dependent methyltransferase